MAALMLVVMMGPNHSFMGSHEAIVPKVEAPRMPAERSGTPLSIEAPEARDAAPLSMPLQRPAAA